MDIDDDGYLSKEELQNFLKSNCKFVDYFHRMGFVIYHELFGIILIIVSSLIVD